MSVPVGIYRSYSDEVWANKLIFIFRGFFKSVFNDILYSFNLEKLRKKIMVSTKPITRFDYKEIIKNHTLSHLALTDVTYL